MKKIMPVERSEMFQTTKVLMYDERLVICNLPIEGSGKKSALVAEMLNLEAKHTSRNVVDVRAPEIRGYHDDRSDSLVRSVYLAADRIQNTKKAATPVMPMGYQRSVRHDVVRQQLQRVRQSGMMPMRGKRLALLNRRLRSGR